MTLRNMIITLDSFIAKKKDYKEYTIFFKTSEYHDII